MTGTLLVHLYGGPGTGKSTTRALVFGALKQRGWNVEEAPEYAKDLVWEGAHAKLRFQPYIAAKQLWRIERLSNQVDAVITDTSSILSLIYGNEDGGVTPAFTRWVCDDYKRRNTLNIFLRRDPRRPYNPKGRTQTEAQAVAADAEIEELLKSQRIDYIDLTVDKFADTHVDEIVGLIEARMVQPCPRCAHTDNPRCDPESEGVPARCIRCKGTAVIPILR